MGAYKKKWYHNIYFEFYLRIPFLKIQTSLFVKDPPGRLAYEICMVRIELHKWKYEFDLYKRERY